MIAELAPRFLLLTCYLLAACITVIPQHNLTCAMFFSFATEFDVRYASSNHIRMAACLALGPFVSCIKLSTMLVGGPYLGSHFRGFLHPMNYMRGLTLTT
jgi:hypothetical protein